MCLAVPAKVMSVEGEKAQVDVEGARQTVRLDTIGEEVQSGDYLLVHTGFAIRRMKEEEAQETLDLFDQLVEAQEEARIEGREGAAEPDEV